MKKIIITIVVIAVLIAGYFFFMRKTQEVTNTNTSSNAKINVDAVCQGALAYMTFPDAASAQVFVTDCKEGKYPEVIERYKAEMNLGEGAAI